MAQTDTALAVPGAPGRALASPPPVVAEAAMARAALRIGVPLTVVCAALAWLVRGPEGGLTALAVSLLVLGSFVATGFAHARAAARGIVALQTVAFVGALLRLALYGVLLVALRGVAVVDGPTLAVVTPVVVLVLLAFEARFVSTRPELWFVDADAGRSDGRDASTAEDLFDRKERS